MGPSGCGKTHAAQLPLRARRDRRRRRPDRGRSLDGDVRPRAHGLPRAAHGLRLPVLQPDARADRGRERRAAAARRARPGRRRRADARWTRSTLVGLGRARRRTCPTSSPAASGSASRSPARSSTTRPSSGPTSRPATSTARTPSEIVELMRRLNLERGPDLRDRHARHLRSAARPTGSSGCSTASIVEEQRLEVPTCTRGSRCLRSTPSGSTSTTRSSSSRSRSCPQLREQPGYEGVYVLTTPEGKGLIMTFWETEEAADGRYRGFYAEQLERYVTLFSSPPGPRAATRCRSPTPPRSG